MPDQHKRRIAALMAERGVAVIDNDIYGEAAHGPHRPCVLQSFDSSGNVLLCSAFTKTLALGLRVGWIAPGRWLRQVQMLQGAQLDGLPGACAGGACPVHARRRL